MNFLLRVGVSNWCVVLLKGISNNKNGLKESPIWNRSSCLIKADVIAMVCGSTPLHTGVQSRKQILSVLTNHREEGQTNTHSGKLTCGKSPFLFTKSSFNGPFSIAVLGYQKVCIYIHIYTYILFFWITINWGQVGVMRFHPISHTSQWDHHLQGWSNMFDTTRQHIVMEPFVHVWKLKHAETVCDNYDESARVSLLDG